MRIYSRNGKLYVYLRAEGGKQKSTGLDDTPANRRLLERELLGFRPSKSFDYYAKIYL